MRVRLCLLNVGAGCTVSKLYAALPFSIGVEQWSIAMVEQLYLRDEPSAGHAPPLVARSDDPQFILAANVIAAWLYEIAGPFFWAAILMLLVLGGVAPR